LTPAVAVVDTNVVVSGILSRGRDSPTRAIVDRMLVGGFQFLLSIDLLAEYRCVLLRARIRRFHGLSEGEIDAILARVAAHGIVREPGAGPAGAPDSGDEHLWKLLATHPGAVLVTGDRLLQDDPPPLAKVLSPRAFMELLGSEPG
jgi:predicted nucleic acid-binding protein